MRAAIVTPLAQAVFALILQLQPVSADTSETCDAKESIASYFRHGPDAWKLLEHTETLYCLVYHSENPQTGSHVPCLCARVTLKEKTEKQAHVLYQFSRNETERQTGVKIVYMKRTDEAYKHYNEIIVKHAINEQLKEEVTRILYADYQSCAVIQSQSLGVQVWVKRDVLLAVRVVPYLCELIYELAAQEKRHMNFHWKQCPERNSFTENTEPALSLRAQELTK